MTKRNPHISSAETVNRSFVLPIEQDKALKRIAAMNHRTFSGEMRLLVENHLAAHADVLDQLEEAA